MPKTLNEQLKEEVRSSGLSVTLITKELGMRRALYYEKIDRTDIDLSFVKNVRTAIAALTSRRSNEYSKAISVNTQSEALVLKDRIIKEQADRISEYKIMFKVMEERLDTAFAQISRLEKYIIAIDGKVHRMKTPVGDKVNSGKIPGNGKK